MCWKNEYESCWNWMRKSRRSRYCVTILWNVPTCSIGSSGSPERSNAQSTRKDLDTLSPWMSEEGRGDQKW
jgi:hypothetical protein